MTGDRQLFQAAWLAYWRVMRAYHRYEVRGLEHLLGGRAVMIAGYHGRPLAHDLCILTVELHERLGYLPHGIAHGAFAKVPGGRRALRELGWFTEDAAALDEAVARGEHLLVAPGGTRECVRPFWDRYRVDWGGRKGYMRLARRYGVPIVPVAATGVDAVYLSLLDGRRWGKRLRLPARVPVIACVGLGGLWPLAAPLPVKIRQWVGPAMDVGRAGDGRCLDTLHREVQRAVQAGLDELRA